MTDIDDEAGPSRSEVEKREQDEKERKAEEDAEQAKLPYRWTQTISDLDVTVSVPGNVKGRDLDICITKTRIRVGLKGQSPIIDVGWSFFLTEKKKKTDLTIITNRGTFLIPSTPTRLPGHWRRLPTLPVKRSRSILTK
jgi:CS domain